MPGADSLAAAVTTGLGFSVLAGLVSGVCYILTQGLPRKKFKKSLSPWHCTICSGQFRSIDGVLEVDRVVRCSKCGCRCCKDKCSRKDDEEGVWTCTRCQPDSWFSTLINILQPNSKQGQTKNMNPTTSDEVDEELLELQKKERQQVRDFIERLVETLLGGDLDNVSVNKLYDDPRYDALYAKFHDDISRALTDLGSALHISLASKWYLPISGQSPCSAHATLKLLIQKFIREATELPKLDKLDFASATPRDDESSQDRTYEDLLSTAIVNKIVQNCQDGGGRSGRDSSRGKEYFFGERNLDVRRGHEDTSSLSSLDDFSDMVSLKVRNCIKEVSSSGDETKDEDEPEPSSSSDWQDNWHLQRRKFDGTNSPVPVPMLVPDPISDAKVLIGDREAEDTTDLSDAASDYDDVVEEPLEPTTLNAVLVNSRTVIGGKNPLESLVSKAESISEDGTTDDSEINVEKEDIVEQLNSVEAQDESLIVETTNENLIHQVGLEDASLMSLDSNTEKDLEYTEKYASLPRQIYKVPGPVPRILEPENDSSDFTADHKSAKTDNVDSGVTSDEDEKQGVFKGSYSEREKEKWNNAVPLLNNPYSKSNLERRLSNRSSNSSLNSMSEDKVQKSLFDILDEERKKTLPRFDRDYYIRQAAKSAGTRKAAEDAEATTPDPDEAPSDPEEDWDAPRIFKAVPAVVQEEPVRLTHLDFSSDSDYSIERTYNLQTGEIVQNPRRPIVETSRSPEGIKYTNKGFDLDENQNDLSFKRRHFLNSLTTPEDESSGSFEVVPPPSVNHFRLVEEIANETPELYETVPISPPAGYKSVEPSHDQLESPEMLQKLHELSQTDQVDRKEPPSSPYPNTPPGSPYVATPSIKVQSPSLEDFSLTYSDVSEVDANVLLRSSSRSTPNLSRDDSGSDATSPSVKRLSRIFDGSKNGKQDVYSLTARSIPRQFRNELKSRQSPAPPTEEATREIVPSDVQGEDIASIPFPKTKSMIEFFEKLPRN